MAGQILLTMAEQGPAQGRLFGFEPSGVWRARGEAVVSRPVGIVVACPCGEVYEVRQEFAGRLLECPSCQRHLRAGPPPRAARAPAPDVDHAFDRDVFLLRERIFTITSKYEVWAEDGTPILYVERPTYPIRTLAAYLIATMTTLMVTGWAGAPLAREGGEALLLLLFPLGGIRLSRGVDVAAPAPSRDDLPRRIAARAAAAGPPGPARRVPDPHVHDRDGGGGPAGEAPEDLPAQRHPQALVCPEPGRRARGHGHR